MLALSYKELRVGYEKGDFTVYEVIEAYLKRIEETKKLNAYITVCSEAALLRAKQSDKNFSNNCPRPLEGMPMGIKDNCCVVGAPMTAASRMLESFSPDYESTITQKLLDAGAIFLGKTNLDEFAMGSSNETSFFGVALNPWSDDAVPGGSSGGSASAVAAGSALTSIGTDTGGSVRQPASFCGVTGMRPTYGRCSRYGLVAFASSLDQPGPLARNVIDNARVLQVIAGHDIKDMTTLLADVPDYVETSQSWESLKGKRFALLREAFEAGDKSVQASILNTTRLIQDLGGSVSDVAFPLQKHGISVYLLTAACEAASNLARYDGMRYTYRSENIKTAQDVFSKSRSEGFGEEVRRRIILGTLALSTGKYDEYYLRVLKIRRVMQDAYLALLKEYDFVLSPTTPSEAFSRAHSPDPNFMYAQDSMTVVSALAGLPGLSMPCGLGDRGLPLGVQIIANFLEEDKIYAAAQILENAIEFTPWLKK